MSLTLAMMIARIEAEIRRDDLNEQVRDAIETAITVYQKQRFRFSDSSIEVPELLFDTVVGQAVYTATANPNIATLHHIDYAFVLIANIWQPLQRRDVASIIYYNQTSTMRGIPTDYGYQANQLILSPVPYGVWQMKLGVFINKPAPATDDEEDNPWMNEAELLIRSRAKYEIASHVTRNAIMQAAMSPDPPAENGGQMGQTYRAWKMLKADANRVASLGRIMPMAF